LLRRLSLLLALGFGCLALAWGLFALHGIFIEERDDAIETLSSRRRALEQYAHKDLDRRLRDRLEGVRPTMDEAAADPLIPALDMWLVDRGRQLLPRTERSLPGSATPAGDLCRELVSGDVAAMAARAEAEDAGSPWAERLGLFAELRRALDAGERAAIERAVRALLAHRARFLIRATLDVPMTLALLRLLQDRASPQPSFVAALLRDGLSAGSVELEGLERALLRQRARFTQADLLVLKEQVAAVAEPAHVLYSDFAARVDEAPQAVMPLPANLGEPMLVAGGRWYLLPPQNERIRGIAVDLPGMLREITVTMRDRGLIGSDDSVEGPTTGDVAVAALPIAIASPDWEPAIQAVQGRYRLKAALEVVIAILVFGVVGLGTLMLRRRQRFVELKSDFVSAVSHELRTPLASIRLMAETLERRIRNLPRARDYPSRIIQDVDALSFLVENILSFNRLSRGRWTPKLERVRLGDVVAKLQQERDLWARRPAELTADGVDSVELRADPDLVQLLLTNLVRNACQYNERTPATIHITVKNHGDWLIEVRDNGIGIAPGESERVFDDFYRAGPGKNSGERGSGLGLAICRKIMEAHRGSIRVARSTPDGSTFELRFPPL
jgi:signal transduction histidine kinase